MIESVKAVVTRELQGERLDVAAVALFDGVSRKKIKSVIDAGGAYINKKRVLFAKQAVREGDVIEFFWQAESNASQGEGQQLKFQKQKAKAVLEKSAILFEDKDFLVVNKPAGLASQATLVSDKESLIPALRALGEPYSKGFLELVHRLDKDTSGIILVARNAAWRNFIEAAFRERKVQKTYEAICFNLPENDGGDLTFPIAKDHSRPNTYFALLRPPLKPRQDVKAAETHYKVLMKFKRAKACLVECEPKTGRTHQIRVHLAAIGCPLLGDKTYSQGIVGHALQQHALRHMLHAARISFKGPDRKLYSFEAPRPADFVNCLESISSQEPA